MLICFLRHELFKKKQKSPKQYLHCEKENYKSNNESIDNLNKGAT